MHKTASQPTPIIVIGMNRSGTKWLSNILCNHSEIIGVQSQRHGGIMETNMFGVMSRKFDLANPDDYVAFVEIWSQSDFVRHTGISKHVFLDEPWPQSCLEMFITLMDRYAKQHAKNYWIQKASPESGLRILPRMASARVIVIQRDFHATVKSTLQLVANKGGQPSVFETVYSTVAQQKMISRMLRQTDVLQVHYDRLRAEPETVVRQVCQHVGVDYEPEMLHVDFQKNTSFGGRKHARVDFATRHSTRLRLLGGMINLIPLPAMQMYATLKSAIRGGQPPQLVRGTFSELQTELAEEQCEQLVS